MPGVCRSARQGLTAATWGKRAPSGGAGARSPCRCRVLETRLLVGELALSAQTAIERELRRLVVGQVSAPPLLVREQPMAPHSAQLGIGADALSSHAESSTTCPMPRKAGSACLLRSPRRSEPSDRPFDPGDPHPLKRVCLTGAGGRSQGLGPPSPKGAWPPDSSSHKTRIAQLTQGLDLPRRAGEAESNPKGDGAGPPICSALPLDQALGPPRTDRDRPLRLLTSLDAGGPSNLPSPMPDRAGSYSPQNPRSAHKQQ